MVNSALKQMLSDIHDLDTRCEHIPTCVMHHLLTVANGHPLEQSGSLLKVHLSVASLNDQVLGLLLGGATNSDLKLYLDTQSGINDKKPRTLKTAWYSACKTISDAAKIAVADAMFRSIPQSVKDANIESGMPDVMDLPLELARLTHGLLSESNSEGTKCDLAANALMAAMSLFDYDPSVGTMKVELLTGWKPFSVELVGSTALFVLGVCPNGKHPKDVLKKRAESLS